jgi:cysteine desulfurase
MSGSAPTSPVYLDNAATTPLDPAVFEAMTPFLLQHFGNPSSTHGHGRQVRAAVEQARKTVASLLRAAPGEITFTSGGTEADNRAIISTARSLGIRRAISTGLEHHAVLHSLEALAHAGEIELLHVRHDARGRIDLNHLEDLLRGHPRALVSLMHANNEIGTLLPMASVGALCRQHDAIFHSDTVQTMGHYPHDVRTLGAHFLVGSAHKFHGPKGVGFLFTDSAVQVAPLIQGGAQERGQRGGTENVAGIIGLAKALEIAYAEMAAHQQHIQGLKDRMIDHLRAALGDDVQFNGASEFADESLYTVLNVSLPPSEMTEMLLFNLDIHKISASGGSACTSGSSGGSHVLAALGCDPSRGAVRFSFSKFTTTEEVDYAAGVLASLYQRVTV